WVQGAPIARAWPTTEKVGPRVGEARKTVRTGPSGPPGSGGLDDDPGEGGEGDRVEVAAEAGSGEHHALDRAAGGHPSAFGAGDHVEHHDVLAVGAVVAEDDLAGVGEEDRVAAVVEGDL